jgi:hypothetical protein
VVLAVLHFLAPVGNIVLNALMQGESLGRYLVFAFSPYYLSRNWPIVLAPIVAGAAIYACKRWSYYVFLLAMSGLVIFSSMSYWSKADIVSIWFFLGVCLCNILLVSYFLIPAVREVYFNRRMRWWETQTRYRTNFRCQWRELNTAEMKPGIVANFSESGLFLKSDLHPQDREAIHIEIPFNQGVVSFAGVAVIHNRSDALGFGVHFLHTPESLQHARSMVADFAKKGFAETGGPLRPEERFTYWVRTLITSGRGWIPGQPDDDR